LANKRVKQQTSEAKLSKIENDNSIKIAKKVYKRPLNRYTRRRIDLRILI